jgi:hypothetical protein
VISTEVANLLESGASLVVGTVDGSGLPDATRAFGAWVLHGPERVRILLATASTRAIENLEAGGRIALTASDVPTNHSLQVKGRALRVEPATPDDLELNAEYIRSFFDKVHETDAIDIELLRKMVPTAYVAVELEVEAVFDQTPGPTAGRCIS